MYDPKDESIYIADDIFRRCAIFGLVFYLTGFAICIPKRKSVALVCIITFVAASI